MIINTPQNSGQFSTPFGVGSKIIRGTNAHFGEIPHQLSLSTPNAGHFCGASLITTILALTAAHCVMNQAKREIRVASGEHNLRLPDGTEQYSTVDKIFIHEDYDSYHDHNDIALLVLSKELTINATTNIIFLPNESTQFKSRALVSGWGARTEGGSTSNVLQRAFVQLISRRECRRWHPRGLITGETLCALGTSGEDTCQGDSGGSLTCKGNDGKTYLCGITSFGFGCGTFPGAYTNVAKYDGWIRSKITKLRSQGICTRSPSRCTINNVPGCSANQFQCVVSKNCIPIDHVCDGDNTDCGSGDTSDEAMCQNATTSTPTICQDGQFQCARTKTCIPLVRKCNGKLDCGKGDRSDETNCSRKLVTTERTTTSTTTVRPVCRRNEFQCALTNKCIPGDHVCDGDFDCGFEDPSDEENCMDSSEYELNLCEEDHFQCSFSEICIPLWHLCDGEYDCGDGDVSDESDCTK